MERSSFTPARLPQGSFVQAGALALFAFFSLALPLHAQVGGDNPTGVSGIFNGQAGGCGYDPYTANATRTITDIAVGGAVGEYPLALVRTANSRAPSTTEVFGWAGGWNHNYNWILEDSPAITSPQPKRYTVAFPDGRVEKFRAVNWNPAENYFRVRPGPDTPAQSTSAGVRERFIPISGAYCYLILADGGKVKFSATQHQFQYNGATYYYYTYRALAIIDPHGLTTTFTYEQTGPKRLLKVTEPAGRYLQFAYVGNSPRISSVTASDGRIVNYYYQNCPGCRLYQVVYYNNPNNWTARYQYTASNIGGELPPLLWTADDPMYAGPMKRIAYQYKTGMNADQRSAVYGQILSERYWDGIAGHEGSGVAVSTLIVGSANPINHNTRKETRGDGATRDFIYNGAGPGYLGWASDFDGVSASQRYDAYKYLNSVTDRRGNITDYTCDSITGNVTQVKFPLTQGDTPNQNQRPTVNYTYTNGYYLRTIQGENGFTTTINRYGDNRIQSIVYPDGGWESFTYDSAHFYQISTHRMTTGGTESWAYDGLHRLQYYSDAYHSNPNDPSIQYFYENHGWVSGVFDALNHPANWTYNDRGQVLETKLATDPVDNQRHTITNVYNPDGTLQSRTDELGHVTSYEYDDYRRLTSVTPSVRGYGDNDEHPTSYYYYDPWANPQRVNYADTNAQASFVLLPSGKALNTVYDANWRKSSVTVGWGSDEAATTSYTYDAVGNVTWVTDPKGYWINTVYDQRNRPSSVNHMGQTTTFTYDTAGHKKTITRPNGQVITNYSFDNMNRVTEQRATQTPDPTAITKYEYYAYGPAGLLHTMKDPRLVATNSTEKYEYLYDSMGRKTWITYPKDSTNTNRSEGFTYDDAGRLETFVNRVGVQTFIYDALNRLAWSGWNDGITPTVGYTYDAASRLTDINNANATIHRVYYNDNLLRSEAEQILLAGGRSKTMTYTYDADGNRASSTYPDSACSYTYTGRNQLKEVNGWATYEYDENGNLTKRAVIPNGTHTDYAYDTLDRVTWVTHSFGRWFNYGYYANSNNRKYTSRWNGQAVLGEAFGYDLADQVTAIKLNIANPDSTAAGSQTIFYDANGNRATFRPYGPTETYYIDNNSLNQYNKRNNINANYNPDGNLTQGFDGSTYTYDAQNRVLTASKNGTTMTFKYDGLNRQVSRTDSQGTTFNVWDGWDLIEEYQSGGAMTASYLYGAGGLILDYQVGNADFNYHYQDGSGSTSHIADSNGNLLEWYRYDLQGTPIVNDDPNNHASALNVRHLFTGQQWYKEIGLYDLRNRFYSPDIGRFLQPDPIGFLGDRTNLYRYCKNNPVTRLDPLGLEDNRVVQLEEIFVPGDEVQVPLAPPPGDISDTVFLPGDLFGGFPTMGSDNPEANRLRGYYIPFPRLHENNQPSVQHPAQSVVPAQNPNLPDPSAALYPPGGTLTLQAANYWYMNGGGKPAVVDATRLDFSAVNPNGFNRKTGRQLYTFPKFHGVTPSQDFLVYGTVTLQLTSDGTFEVLTDTYNFEMHPWQPRRNILTIIGNIYANPNPFMHGTPYPIIFYNTVPVP